MTEPTAPQLTESDINEYEQRRYAAVRSYHSGDDVNWFLTVAIPALIRDWRALKADLRHQCEAKEAYKTVLERRDEENAVLREQLAQVTGERDGLKRRIEEMRDERR